MKKQFAFLAASIAATLATGTALANDPTGPFGASVNIAGSSAFQAAFESELGSATSSICVSATYNKYQSNTNDFRAYTCTLKPNVASVGGGENAVIYYRGEGGSVMGLKPLLAAGPQIKRLDLSSCTRTLPLGDLGTNACTTNTYTPSTDAVVSGLVGDVVQVGFADEEPVVFVGENYPTNATFNFIQPAMTVPERTTLNGLAAPVVAQGFGVFINNTGALSGLASLSKNTISNIFKGNYTTWDQVPTEGGGVVTNAAQPIKLCRREGGSGTQTAAALFFNATTGFASEAQKNNLSLVQENASSGSMRTCIDGNAGAIGYVSMEKDAGNRKLIKIDGKGPSDPTVNNVGPLIATGEYDLWYEMVAIKRSGLTGTTLNLANKLITVSQTQATGPITPNVAFLSGPNSAVYPIVNVPNKQPISCVRRNKDSKAIGAWQC